MALSTNQKHLNRPRRMLVDGHAAEARPVVLRSRPGGLGPELAPGVGDEVDAFLAVEVALDEVEHTALLLVEVGHLVEGALGATAQADFLAL